jgi:hypothetical protein
MDTLFFHPKLVHLPIALAVLMPFISAALCLAWWRQWLPARAFFIAVLLQGVLVGTGLLAEESGEEDEERVERVVPEALIEAHAEAAETFVAASGVAFAVLLAGALAARRRAGLPLALAGVATTVVVLGLGVRVGEAGGALVYKHGAAAAFTKTPAANAPVAPHAERDDD